MANEPIKTAVYVDLGISVLLPFIAMCCLIVLDSPYTKLILWAGWIGFLLNTLFILSSYKESGVRLSLIGSVGHLIFLSVMLALGWMTLYNACAVLLMSEIGCLLLGMAFIITITGVLNIKEFGILALFITSIFCLIAYPYVIIWLEVMDFKNPDWILISGTLLGLVAVIVKRIKTLLEIADKAAAQRKSEETEETQFQKVAKSPLPALIVLGMHIIIIGILTLIF